MQRLIYLFCLLVLGVSSIVASIAAPDPSISACPGVAPKTCPSPGPVSFWARIEGKYKYVGNNCHDFANNFCDKYPGARVLMCNGERDAEWLSGHTANIAKHPSGKKGEWCIIEPQNARTCCFSQPNSEDDCGGKVNIDFDEVKAKACYIKMCEKQALTEPTSQCKVMPLEYRAVTHIRAFKAALLKKTQEDCIRSCEDTNTDSLEHLSSWTNSEGISWDCMSAGDSEIRQNLSTLKQMKDRCLQSCQSIPSCIKIKRPAIKRPAWINSDRLVLPPPQN